MIRENTIICDECSCISLLKNHNFHTINDEDFCKDCIDGAINRLNNKKRGDE